MRALSICIRNWCVLWAYVSGTNACTERSPFKTCWSYASGTDAYPWAYASGTDAFAEHMRQELMCTLSISFLCAYAQHKHKNSKFEQFHSNYIWEICTQIVQKSRVYPPLFCGNYFHKERVASFSTSPWGGGGTLCLIITLFKAKAVNRGDKRSRRYRDRHFAKFERSRCYRDRYRC
jgi:hypothetical protein